MYILYAEIIFVFLSNSKICYWELFIINLIIILHYQCASLRHAQNWQHFDAIINVIFLEKCFIWILNNKTYHSPDVNLCIEIHAVCESLPVFKLNTFWKDFQSHAYSHRDEVTCSFALKSLLKWYLFCFSLVSNMIQLAWCNPYMQFFRNYSSLSKSLKWNNI